MDLNIREGEDKSHKKCMLDIRKGNLLGEERGPVIGWG